MRLRAIEPSSLDALAADLAAARRTAFYVVAAGRPAPARR